MNYLNGFLKEMYSEMLLTPFYLKENKLFYNKNLNHILPLSVQIGLTKVEPDIVILELK